MELKLPIWVESCSNLGILYVIPTTFSKARHGKKSVVTTINISSALNPPEVLKVRRGTIRYNS